MSHKSVFNTFIWISNYTSIILPLFQRIIIIDFFDFHDAGAALCDRPALGPFNLVGNNHLLHPARQDVQSFKPPSQLVGIEVVLRLFGLQLARVDFQVVCSLEQLSRQLMQQNLLNEKYYSYTFLSQKKTI